MIKALIFDFDGLILDTEMPEYQSWQEIFAEYNCELPFSTWASFIGTAAGVFEPHDFLEQQYGQVLEREAIRKKRQERFDELMKQQKLLPGVEDYFRAAQHLGLKLAVASSSSHKWVDGYLAYYQVEEYFEAVKCADDVKKAKPDPELYLAALSALQVQAHEAIAFEDSPNGVRAATQAGIFCVAVPNEMTKQLPLEQADLRLNSLAEMPLEKLLARFS